MKLSVIVPIYGVERYLREALESLRAQSAEGVEYILVDDGSKDGCGAIVDRFAASDGRFRAIHQENGGYGKAVNRGFREAKGEYIAIFEPDDWIEPDFYEGLLMRAEETKADIVKTGVTAFFSDTDKPISWGFDFDAEAKGGLVDAFGAPRLFSLHPSIWSCVYRRGFLEENGIEMEETPGACWQDNLFQVKTVGKAKKIAFAPGRGYHYRDFLGKKPPKGERILEVVGSIREWLKENKVDSPEISAAQSIRELAYVGLAFDWSEPFRLIPIMKRVVRSLRAVPEEWLLGIIDPRLKQRCLWARAGVAFGIFRQVAPRVKDAIRRELGI